jgi:hypothetical protein
MVLLHVSCGTELALTPGFNIIGMLQPVGARADMLNMLDMVLRSSWDVPVGYAIVISVSMDSEIDIVLYSDLLRMLMLMDESMDIEAIVVDVGIGMPLVDVSDTDDIDIVESIGTGSCGSFET